MQGYGETRFPHTSARGRVWEGAALPRRTYVHSRSCAAEPHGRLMKMKHMNPRAVGLMVFEKFIRYAGLAVGLKPSATECEARLRGLYRIIYSKTMMPALPGDM